MSGPINPSRALADLLHFPHPNTQPHLLAIANESLSDLYNTQVTTHQAHSEARKRFVIARAWFDEVSTKNREKSGGGGNRNLDRAQEMCEQALREMEVRKGEVERCDGEVGRLKGDIAFLTELIKESHGGDLRGTDGQISPSGLESPRMLGEEKHTESRVVSDQETGRDLRVGFAM